MFPLNTRVKLMNTLNENREMWGINAPLPATLERYKSYEIGSDLVRRISGDKFSIEDVMYRFKNLLNFDREDPIFLKIIDIFSVEEIVNITNNNESFINYLMYSYEINKIVSSIYFYEEVLIPFIKDGKIILPNNVYLKYEVEILRKEIKEDMNKELGERYLVLDTETNGFLGKGEWDGFPLSIGIVELDKDLKPLDVQQYYIRIPVELNTSAQSVHGLTKEFLDERGEAPDVVVNKILDRFGNFQNHTIVGHNISFDLGILNKLFARCGEELEVNKSFCTMRYIKSINRGTRKGAKLGDAIEQFDLENDINIICKTIGIEPKQHTALYDTIATVQLFTRIRQVQGNNLTWNTN